MSNFTVQVRWLIENNFDFQLTEYPIFDETYRNVLNKKILDHYKFREIGFETPALFRHYLKTALNEIMPYYNQLYKSQLLEFNPLYDVDYQENYNKTSTNHVENTTEGTSHNQNTSTTNGTTESTDNSNSKNLKTDTGQGAIGITNIDDVQFATEVDFNKSNGTGSTTSNGTATDNTSGTISNTSTTDLNNTDEYTRHVLGNRGNKNYSQLLNDFRTTFLNIDLEIINHPEVQQLFYGLW